MNAETAKRQWGETEKETMTQPQEEFVAQKSVPSRDISQLQCARCGKPRKEWEGNGVESGGEYFCSPECAAASSK